MYLISIYPFIWIVIVLLMIQQTVLHLLAQLHLCISLFHPPPCQLSGPVLTIMDPPSLSSSLPLLQCHCYHP